MTTTREELLQTLGQLSVETPDLRFGQIIANVATLAHGPVAEAIWDAEDDEMLAAAQRLLERYRGRKAHVA